MGFEQKVCSIVKKVPRGKVATYGQVAAMAGSPRAARAVGMILRNCSKDLPWQRIINRRGEVSIVNFAYPASLQRDLLTQEGVVVKNDRGLYKVDLDKYLWSA
jgi:methylated-DNA-protein-cysteine methyltransferase-like protein